MTASPAGGPPDGGSGSDAHPATVAANGRPEVMDGLQGSQDQEDALRGFVASIPDARIHDARGRVVWTHEPYRFLDDAWAPDTVNPSLWRQARLNALHGLFKVTERIYQVRGFDLANITFVEGEEGVVVIDPLTFEESSRAALALYREHRGVRRVSALIYSHSHRDHYGGAGGVVDLAEVKRGEIPVVAPAGFLEAVVAESVLAGAPMRRRSQYQFGNTLRPGVRGHVDSGLGKVVGSGTSGLLPPTVSISRDGQRTVLDGVEIEFQLTPGAEAPAEMNFFFPQLRALNLAENACHTMHNLCPLRGAKTRDALAWSRYLDDALERYAGAVDVACAQHHWPVWGAERIGDFLRDQRDLYKSLHDQTLRWMAHGLTPPQIAEKFLLSEPLRRKPHVRGYYGTVAHNVQAIYTHYLGAFEGQPSRLHPLTSEVAGRKYLQYMGGAELAMSRARGDFERGEFRWVLEVMRHVIAAAPERDDARALAAAAMEQLGYQAESASWRNCYLLGARELRQGRPQAPATGHPCSPDILGIMSLADLFDHVGIRFRPETLDGQGLRIDWLEPDKPEWRRLDCSPAAITHRPGRHDAAPAHAQVVCARAAFVEALRNGAAMKKAIESQELKITGEVDRVVAVLLGLDTFDPGFAIGP